MEHSVADGARMAAARRNTSLSRLVGEMLAEKIQRDDAYKRAMREALAFKPIPFEGRHLTRDENDAERLGRFR